MTNTNAHRHPQRESRLLLDLALPVNVVAVFVATFTTFVMPARDALIVPLAALAICGLTTLGCIVSNSPVKNHRRAWLLFKTTTLASAVIVLVKFGIFWYYA